MGRNWLQHIHLNRSEILHLTTVDKVLVEVLDALSPIFQEGLGKVVVKAKIYVDPMEKPRFLKPGL